MKFPNLIHNVRDLWYTYYEFIGIGCDGLNDLTYIQLLNRTLEIYLDKGPEEGYEFIANNYVGVIGNDAQIYNFRYSLAAASGLKDEALKILNEAVKDKGYWYSYDYLRKDQDLKILRKEQDFKEILEICKRREDDAIDNNPFMVKHIGTDGAVTLEEFAASYVEDNFKKDKVFMGFHGDQESFKIMSPYWDNKVLKDYDKVFCQSEEILFTDAYGWDDLEQCSNNISKAYSVIKEKYSSENTILGGFSAGARIALYSLLLDKIDCKGFVFVAPWLPEIQSWDILFEKLKGRGLKFYIVCGEDDEDCFESTNDFIETLDAYEIDHMYRVVENLDHDYPVNFEEILKEAVDFING